MSNLSTFYTTDNNYSVMSDEQLIELIKQGDKYAIDFLIEKYKDLVNMKVGKYFMIGAEKEVKKPFWSPFFGTPYLLPLQ